MTISEERKQFALKVFQDYPEKTDAVIKEKILLQQVIEGMSPYEAHLAAGQFSYNISADQKIWPANADPIRVMWAQSLNPDDSKISMTFENDTQFPAEGTKKFCVDFIKGKAASVCKL